VLGRLPGNPLLLMEEGCKRFSGKKVLSIANEQSYPLIMDNIIH
jgi:hypothetical protein